jgi:hypothetical protein
MHVLNRTLPSVNLLQGFPSRSPNLPFSCLGACLYLHVSSVTFALFHFLALFNYLMLIAYILHLLYIPLKINRCVCKYSFRNDILCAKFANIQGPFPLQISPPIRTGSSDFNVEPRANNLVCTAVIY